MRIAAFSFGPVVEICHEDCIKLVDEIARIDHELCSTCTQCIAICPQQALSWGRVPPVSFDPARLPTADQMDELFKERRTMRHFREAKLDRALVEEIVSYGIYAPTNNYNLRAVVVDDPAVIAELERINLRFVKRMYDLFYRPKPVFNLLRRLTPAMQEKDKVKIEAGLEEGQVFSYAPTKGESILAILLLGYPAVQFENKVAGKAMPVQWIDRGKGD